MQTMPKPIEVFKSASLASFTGVLSHDVPQYWPLVECHIKRGLAKGETLENHYERLMKREEQLWIAFTSQKVIAACLTELVTLDNRKVCNIISIGGSGILQWLHHIKTLEAFAKAKGCAAMRYPEIRKGWQRVLKDYHVTKITLEKAL
jgi:hypothetical protein